MHNLFRHFFSRNGLLCLVAGGMVFVNPQTAKSQQKKATEQVAFQVTPACSVSKTGVNALAVLDIVSRGTYRGETYVHKEKLLVRIFCYDNPNECVGFQVRIWDEKGGNQVDTLSATPYLPMKLLSINGNIATVELGYATFTIDAGLGKLSKRTSFPNGAEEGFGEGRCPSPL